MRTKLSGNPADTDNGAARRASGPMPTLIVGFGLLVAIVWTVAPAIDAVIRVLAR